MIGAGMGGLTCAALLAKRGHRVALFEQHDRSGGYCSSFTRDGYTFDVGVDSVAGLGPSGRIGRILGLAGLPDSVERLRLPAIRGNVFPGESFVVPNSAVDHRERLAARFPTEADGLRRLFDDMAEIARGAATVAPESLWDGTPVVGRFPALDRWRQATFLDLLAAHLRDPVLWAWLSERTPYVALPPSRVSAVTMCVLLMSYFQGGAWRVRGGYQRLSDALVATARAAGAGVRLETSVEEILVEDGAVAGVRTSDGETWRSRAIVSNGDLAGTLSGLLPAGFAPAAAGVATEGRPSLSLFLLYIGAAVDLSGFRLPSSLGIFPSTDLEAAFHVQESATGAAEGTGFGLEIPTLLDPSVAPPGRHVLIVHYPAPYGTAATPSERDGLVGRILDRIEATVVPGLREGIEVLLTASPRTLERFTRNRRGSPYGFEQSPERYRVVRDLAANLPPGFHVAGHWSDFGGGVASAVASGYVRANVLSGAPVGRRVPGPAAVL